MHLNNIVDLEQDSFKKKKTQRHCVKFGMTESQIATVFNCTRVETRLSKQEHEEKHSKSATTFKIPEETPPQHRGYSITDDVQTRSDLRKPRMAGAIQK